MRKKGFCLPFFGRDFLQVFWQGFIAAFTFLWYLLTSQKCGYFFYNWPQKKNMVFDLRFEYHKKLHKIKFNVCVHFFCNNFSKCSKTKQKYYHPLSQYIQYQQNAESTHTHIYTWRKTYCPPLGLDINETEKKKVDESNKTRSRVVKTNGPCSNVAATAVCNAHFYLHQALQKTQWNTSAVGLESSQKKIRLDQSSNKAISIDISALLHTWRWFGRYCKYVRCTGLLITSGIPSSSESSIYLKISVLQKEP